MPPETSSTQRDDAPPGKSTLICQTCGHRSPPSGDWVVSDRRDARGGRAQVYECPVCGAVLTVRPVFDAAHDPVPT
jgi:hypothetical protein